MNDAERDSTRNPQRYYGKYRGTVVSNIDPERRGRVLATVTDVQGLTPLSWAMPCLPFAGIQEGALVLPQIGSGVWVEFEQGNPDYPIWVGGFWGSFAEVPLAVNTPPAIPPGQNIVFQTGLNHLFVISDAVPIPMLEAIQPPAPPGTGGIVLRSPGGAMIVVNDTGIFINNGKGASVNLVGPSVLINKDALVVLK
jgi:Type VI secretion system/phage-baseplate injector OB domain